MGVSYTPEQQKVIDTHGCNLLVSAAAGSGKTAVLVERIVKMVSDGTHPVDIDRLLVVTFTNAAAAQMRERISSAISAGLVKEPENEHLQKQAALLHNAQITTIDSFCLFVIRNHFHTIGLDPGFRIADEGELKLLRNDVLGEVLEECYQAEEASFLQCMEYFSVGSRDKAIEEAVLKLYDFAMSNPFPEEWLEERKGDYVLFEDSVSALTKQDWMRQLMEKLSLSLQGLIDQFGQCIKICDEPDGPYMYGELLENEKEQLEKLLAAQNYEERFPLFSAFSFGRLSSKKDETVSAQKRELVKNIRTEIKERLQAMQKEYFAYTPEEAVRQMAVCGEAVCALAELTHAFMEAFARTKREKNILDFDDIEHFALSILLRHEDGMVVPTETALEYRSHFEEILIDEYQDSNLVQEYLLSAISGEPEKRFNRFMVGDVKQSIYKFRLARPELFMEKYDAYSSVWESDTADSDTAEHAATDDGMTKRGAAGVDKMRIDLHKNFRSREEVLCSTNAVFAQVMRKELGGIIYDENAALYPGAFYPEADCAGISYDAEVLLFTEKETANEEKSEAQKVERNADKADSAESDVTLRQQEAYGIARKIKQLVDSFQVTNGEDGILRKASYKDIVILLRTTAGWDEEFKQILEEEGIPVHVTSKTGYFAATEVQELLHFLRILDNPLQDIPFYGVLHSYFGGFSEEEVASVKASFPGKRYLYDAVREYAAAKEPNAGEAAEADAAKKHAAECAGTRISDALQHRLSLFLEQMEHYRDMAVYMPVHELLQTIIREYAYLSYVAAKPGGSRRRANVEMLLIKASDYEKTSYYGLYHFLRYIEQLEKYDVDYGEANLQDENADVVRIMSIHKSKGLEFPICFVAGLAKSFNMRDASEHLVMDVADGIGVDYVNPDKRIRSRNLRRNYIAAKLRQENLAEELRILYVAMTRAKEKLILTGAVKSPRKKISSLMMLQGIQEITYSYDTLMQMKSFLDVMLYASARNKCFDSIWSSYDVLPNTQNPLYEEEMKLQWSVISWEDTLGDNIEEALTREGDRRRLVLSDAADRVDRIDKDFMTVMSERFSYRYPYENLKDLYTKTTVSELKKAGMQEETDFSFPLYEEEPIVPYLPKFIKQDERVSGTDRGSAFHKVMELFDFSILTHLENEENSNRKDSGEIAKKSKAQMQDKRKCLEEAVRGQLEGMLREGKLSQAYYDAVSIPKIISFLKSKVAKRMAAADAVGKLYREQPFVLGLPANRLNEDFPAEETVLIQGIIDVFFEEDGSYVVVDYKTDVVQTPEELIRRYKTQLDYYAEALEQLSGYQMAGGGMRTAEKIIYSFKLEREISL